MKTRSTRAGDTLEVTFTCAGLQLLSQVMPAWGFRWPCQPPPASDKGMVIFKLLPPSARYYSLGPWSVPSRLQQISRTSPNRLVGHLIN